MSATSTGLPFWPFEDIDQRTTSPESMQQGALVKDFCPGNVLTDMFLQVNADPDLLAGHYLGFNWADTHADTLYGTLQLTNAWKNGSIAFFGPEDSCDVEARVAAAWNLPMISYVGESFAFERCLVLLMFLPVFQV